MLLCVLMANPVPVLLSRSAVLCASILASIQSPAGQPTRLRQYATCVNCIFRHLNGLSYEIDFENVDENLQILALTRAAAGYADSE